jgi:phytoene dehydrogenase-like protein
MPTNSYDAIIVGDDLAALTCAALCARRGLRTLWLPHDERPARYPVGPHKLPVEPLLWPARGGKGGERVLKELGVDLAVRRKARELRLAAQIVAPDVRIDLAADAEAFARELDRELSPAAGATVRAAWDGAAPVSATLDAILAGGAAFPAIGFWERRDAGKLAGKLEADAAAWWQQATGALVDPGAHAAVIGPAVIAAGDSGVAPAAAARALELWRAGVTPLRGDGDALRELLIEKLAGAGGEVRHGQVVELTMSWGKIGSVVIDRSTGLGTGRGEELGCGQVITSLPPGVVFQLLGKKAPRRLLELQEGLTYVGRRFTVNIVMDGAGVPEGMAPIVLFLQPGRPPVADAAFAIHVGEPDDGGRVVVSLSAVLADPVQDETELARAADALRKALLARLDEIMPFYRRHLVMVHSPHQASAPEVPGGRGGHEAPKGLPYPMREIWRGTTEGGAGIAALPYATGIKNLTLTGGQILPGLGVEGELVSGWSAARLAMAISGKKKDYLRDEVVGAGG